MVDPTPFSETQAMRQEHTLDGTRMCCKAPAIGMFLVKWEKIEETEA